KTNIWKKIEGFDFATMGTVVFFATFSLIFLFVSSVGALCMHYSLRAFNALFGGISPENPEHAMPAGVRGFTYCALGKGEWRPLTRKDLADQRQRIFHAQRLIGDAGYRESLMQRFFSEFSAGYMEGLHDRDSSPHRITGMVGTGFKRMLGNSESAGGSFDELRDEMRTELAEARADWSAAAIQERLPSDDLRQSLGYNPGERGRGNPFAFVSNLSGGRRKIREAEVSEDRRLADERGLPAPSERERLDAIDARAMRNSEPA